MFGVLTDVENRSNLPVRHFLCGGHFTRFALHGLTHGERNARAGLGEIFTQHQHRIVALDITQRRGVNAAVAQHVKHQLKTRLLARSDTGREVFCSHQLAQGEVALHAGAR